MIAEFMHFYSYRLSDVLDMHAKNFYTLLANMYRLQGVYNAQKAYQMAVSFAGGDSYSNYIKQQGEQAQGFRKYIEELRVIRSIKK